MLQEVGVRQKQLEGDQPFLPYEKIAALWERAAEMTGDDMIGFRRGQEQKLKLGGPLIYMGMAAPTLGHLICNLSKYRRVFGDATEIDVGQLNDQGLLQWRFRVPANVVTRQSIEYGSAALTGGARKLTGRQLSPIAVTF